MTGWAVGAATMLCMCSCESNKSAAPSELRAGLRVPLPDGWRAASISGGLQVGPPGRVVLQLESTAKPLPTFEAFTAAIEREGVEITKKESLDKFMGALYSIRSQPASQAAFLGILQTGSRTIWCSTTSSALPDEIDAAMTVCRSLSWEG